MAVLLLLVVVLTDSSEFQGTQAPGSSLLRPVAVAHAKEFVIEGTVDCGRASGQPCTVWPLLTVWTSDVTGERQRVIVDLSWVLAQLDSYDQDDPIVLEVRLDDDGTIRALSVLATRDAPTSNRRDEQDTDEKPPAPTATPTATGTPAPTHTATVTPTSTPVPQIDLSLTKSGSASDCNINGCITEWTITVTNAGPDVAHNVVVIDRPLAGLTVVTNAVVSQGSYNTATNRWTIGTIGVGVGNQQTATLTFARSVEDSLTESWRNEAEVESADGHDINSTPNNNNPAENDQDTENVLAGCGSGGSGRPRTSRVGIRC